MAALCIHLPVWPFCACLCVSGVADVFPCFTVTRRCTISGFPCQTDHSVCFCFPFIFSEYTCVCVCVCVGVCAYPVSRARAHTHTHTHKHTGSVVLCFHGNREVSGFSTIVVGIPAHVAMGKFVKSRQ